MPHVPRRPPPSGIPPELLQPPRDKPPLPPAPTDTQVRQEDARKKIGLGTINLHTHEVDAKQMVKTLLGREPSVDPYTGQLVLGPKTS